MHSLFGSKKYEYRTILWEQCSREACESEREVCEAERCLRRWRASGKTQVGRGRSGRRQRLLDWLTPLQQDPRVNPVVVSFVRKKTKNILIWSQPLIGHWEVSRWSQQWGRWASLVGDRGRWWMLPVDCQETLWERKQSLKMGRRGWFVPGQEKERRRKNQGPTLNCQWTRPLQGNVFDQLQIQHSIRWFEMTKYCCKILLFLSHRLLKNGSFCD